MISREEYNKALDIVEAYQKQIFGNGYKTKVNEWNKLSGCSARLSNILEGKYLTTSQLRYKIEYIEDITKKTFKKQRNAGLKSWNEFVELRGY
tara:strand:- start:5336 stop:5614 length:279 start_codon:yes stop_codon:yes gene_type:complete